MGEFPNKATQWKAGSKRVKRLAPIAGKKGGLAKTDKKKLSAKLRYMKRKGITKTQMESFELAMIDPDICGSDYLRLVEQYEDMAKKSKDPDMIKSAAFMKAKAYDMFHKDKSTNVNIQINNIMTGDQRTDIIGRLIKE